MSNSASASQQVCEDFLKCLSQVAALGARCEIDMNKEKTGSDVLVKVVPESDGASPIEARLELDFGVYLLFGVSAQFEVPFSKGYYTGADWLTELGMLCRAVANGNFQERLIYVGLKIVYSKHQLVLENGKKIRESWGIRPILPWAKTRTVEHHYAAYGPYLAPVAH